MMGEGEDEKDSVRSIPFYYRCSTPEGTTLLVQQSTFFLGMVKSRYRHRFRRFQPLRSPYPLQGDLWPPVGGQ